MAFHGISLLDAVSVGIPYGLGAGAIDAALNNYVALHYNSRHMSWLHCFWGVGTIISPYIMSYAPDYVGMAEWLSHGVFFCKWALAGDSARDTSCMEGQSQGQMSKKAEQAAVIGIRGALKIKGVPQLVAWLFSYCSLESNVIVIIQ